MKNKERKLKSWQGWLIFSSSMVVVFCLGLLAASVTERRTESRDPEHIRQQER